jgi:hypothetical protein
MKTFCINVRLLTLSLSLLIIPHAVATTVIAPTFTELVAQSESVLWGEVTAINSELVTQGNSRAIFTRVTVTVREQIIGTNPTTVTLEFLGGTVGELTMVVDGMPRFAVGQNDILFVQNNGRQICPLVGMAHGRYSIVRDPLTGTDQITRDNGATLTNVAQVSHPLTKGTLTDTLQRLGGTPLTPAAFIAEIRAEKVRQFPINTR